MSERALAALPDLSRPCRGRVFKYGDNVNTDVIFPGKYTYTLSRPEEVAPHALEDLDPDFATLVRPGDVVVGGANWGCGSSREQAAVCLRYSGVAAVIARSFGRIFYRNAINNGLLALTCPAAVDGLETGDEVELDVAAGTLRRWQAGGGEGTTFRLPPMGETVRSILDAGGLIPWTLHRLRPVRRA